MKRLKMSISQSTRKCTSIILSLVMVISLFSFSMITTNATSDTATKTVNVNDATKATDVEGLVTDKTAKDNGDGTFTLNLEAYAKGEITQGKAEPIDFILVLDQSGSMGPSYGTITNTTYNPTESKNWTYNSIDDNDYYYLDQDGNYYLLRASYERKNGSLNYYLCYTKNFNVKRIGTTSTSKKTPLYTGILYKKQTEKISKKEALKRAVSSFVNSVKDNAQSQDVNHKVAMVGFATGKYTTGYDEENTGILTRSDYTTKAFSKAKEDDYKNALVDVNVNGNVNPIISKEGNSWNDKKQGAIQRIGASGATDTQSGMEMAEKVIEQNNNGRKKVIIMFTDGQPGTGGNVNRTIANGTISSAYKCKTNFNAAVYTIGLFTGNEASDTDVNKFMNYTSSNYPNAKSMTDSGLKESEAYYSTVTDGDALTKVFGDIAQDSAAPSIDLNASAILQDVLSDEFVLANEGVDSVKVYTTDYNGNSEFGQRTEFTDAKIAINDKIIQVSGFNYAENFCVDGQGEIQTSGKKLIVEIKVKRNQTTYGGNGIPTNTIASAIYDGKDHSPVETFPIPTVNLDTRYDITTNDKSIYLGESVNANELVNLLENYNGEKNEGFAINCKPDGKNNKYVNITYSLVDKDGNIVATTEVKAGKSLNGNLFTKELNDLNENSNYKIVVTINNINDASQVNDKVENKKIEKSANIYVFTPVIQATDQTIFYGDKADDLVKRLTVTSWTCKDSNAAKPDSKKPVVTYELKQVNGESIPDNLTLEDTLDVKIENVKLNGKAVDSQYVQIIKDECTLKDHEDGRDFTIHVVKGQIEINKNITAQYSNESKINSYQTFVYKIERSEKVGGEAVETFYQTLSFKANENKTEAKAVISNLKKGYYTVTEEESWSKKYTLSSTTDNYQSLNGEVGAGKKLPIGTFDKNTGYYGLDEKCYQEKGFNGKKAQVTFKNDLKSWAGWYSDAAGSKNTFNKK